jgi:hypothetical protein
MSRSLAAVALLWLLHAASASADTTEPSRGLYRERSIALAGQKHVEALTTEQAGTASLRQTASTQARSRSFVRRRPVISGMLIGMAAGTAIAAAAAGNEAAFVGFYGGAFAGAGLGWALSR